MDASISSVTLIGAGNVAWHLGGRLRACGLPVTQVFSRSEQHARALALHVQAQAIDQLEHLSESKDQLFIIAVSDNAIAEIAAHSSKFLSKGAFVVHTSGATPSSVLAPFFPSSGVFYPLQTFSKNSALTFDGLPICVYSPDKKRESSLFDLAMLLSANARRTTDKERARLHLAAIFVNNFCNYLYHIADDLLKEKELPFELLLPLMEGTLAKLKNSRPIDVQTGPARRGDTQTIRTHLEALEQTDYRMLYELLSHQIMKLYGHKL
ncbi:MAG TPA: DUF2520 domain-containing protein [Saprospiraceae bacterium]|nr:DUF2520 domain-containing protein [Saprospiraceae bacterium]HMQ82581.1 DUF2520 domain-containing protein [Saprospiraceae bacterium]